MSSETDSCRGDKLFIAINEDVCWICMEYGVWYLDRIKSAKDFILFYFIFIIN